MEEHQLIGIEYQSIRDDYIEDSMTQHYMEFDKDRQSRFWDHAFPQVEIAYDSTIQLNGYVSFAIVYRKVPHLLLDVAKLPIGEKFNSAASVMTELVLDVQEPVRLKLEKSNKSIKRQLIRRDEKLFEKEDIMMVYFKRENLSRKSLSRAYRSRLKLEDEYF